jgi:DNA polymerase-3 subunit beta
MKLIVMRSNLNDAVSMAERAVGGNLNLQILKNLLIEAADNKILVTGTNLEIAITAAVPGKVIENGKFTAPAGLLANIIGNIQSDRLNIEDKKGRLEIKTDNYNASAQGMPAEDFPITPKIKDTNDYIEIKGLVLKEALEQTLIAAQYSDLRQELNNIFFNFSVNTLKIVATDSFRLGEKTIGAENFSTNHKEGFSFLVPLKTVQELARIIKDEDVVKIYHDENQILVKAGQAEILSRLSEGSFPDYAAIIPKKFAAEIIFKRQELLNALKLAGIFGSKSGEVRLRASESKKTIEILSSDQTLGENSYTLPAKIQGKLGEIIFNWRYIVDALKAIKSEDVFFGVNSGDEPALIKSPNEASYIYVLKPIAE